MPRPSLLRFVVRYELFRRALDVKGSVIECGVRQGGGLFAWAKLSSTLEPFAIHRRVIGFDTFEGFPALSAHDEPAAGTPLAERRPGGFAPTHDVHGELSALAELHDRGRILGHHPKIELVRGDACETIPRFVAENRHLLVALLFLDFDLYEPTRAALEHLLPRMPKGAVIAFDEVNSAYWPGETEALLERFDLRRLRLRKFPFDPNVAWAVL
ncbi:MAG: class I SAM-dependent methyltransferase [Deltaproteobacteria bacterium]|nr:class I SAM-dependent methyltransferase [Deltaproteobacteria bacterium]